VHCLILVRRTKNGRFIHNIYSSCHGAVTYILNNSRESLDVGTPTLLGGAPRTNMKRGIAVLLSLCALVTAAYFTASKWAIRHETLTFHDPARNNRPVSVDIAVRRDKEMKANAGMLTLPVAILNHGNTVEFTEYSFLANLFAARGYLAISIQHDLPTDAPLVTKVGELYVGRLPIYHRGIANIRFAVDEIKKIEPNADYDRLTMVGHSNGGDISMYFAKMYPDQIKKVVTLDNLRVPFTTEGKFKILSFRSKDAVFKPDPGVIPAEDICEKSGITIVQTSYRHTDMSDRGPENVKSTIQSMLDKFLDDDSPLRPVETNTPKIIEPGPVALYAPVRN
jgi:pimeloyl-ACP methyl ester carboxylesterase